MNAITQLEIDQRQRGIGPGPRPDQSLDPRALLAGAHQREPPTRDVNNLHHEGYVCLWRFAEPVNEFAGIAMIFWVQHGVVSVVSRGQDGGRLLKVDKTSFENERRQAIEI